jgi:hypothetical protein
MTYTVWVARDGEFPEMLLDELTEAKANQLCESYYVLHPEETVWHEASGGQE